MRRISNIFTILSAVQVCLYLGISDRIVYELKATLLFLLPLATQLPCSLLFFLPLCTSYSSAGLGSWLSLHSTVLANLTCSHSFKDH